jgi:very-short-patch-repair endonuclease
MTISFREYKNIITERARELRKHQTPAESIFWQQVRGRKFYGLKFLRQYPILHNQNNSVQFFIADFYCHDLRLIVEIDGDIHNTKYQQEYDLIREETLGEMGYRIIRFSNKDVQQNIYTVLTNLTHYTTTFT